MSERYDRISDFLSSQEANELLAHDYQDHLQQMQEDYNATIDDCVEYGSFDYEEGERLKREYTLRRLGRTATE
jgi:hypothetical protein